MPLQSIQHKQILGVLIVIAALALPALGGKVCDWYGRHEVAAAKVSLAAYALSATDLTKPVKVGLADGHDYYVTIKNNSPGCTTVYGQRILGTKADGKVADVEDTASVTGTFCNMPVAVVVPPQ